MVTPKPDRKRGVRRLLKDRSGVSAVEFALILPLMLTLYIGGVQISDGLTVSRKVTHVTSTLADLVAQAKTISASDMSNIFDAAEGIMSPYSDSNLKMKVSVIAINNGGVAKVSWSQARNDTPLATNGTVTLPSGVSQPNTYVVAAEVNYAYTPWIGYVLSGTINLGDTFYLRPRLSDTITGPS